MRGCYEVKELAVRGPLLIESAHLWHISIPMLEPFCISSDEVGLAVGLYDAERKPTAALDRYNYRAYERLGFGR